MKGVKHFTCNTDDFHVSMTTDTLEIEAGKPILLQFKVEKDNQAVALDISHDKKMHLIIVNEYLTWFRHLHPKEEPGNKYAIEEIFPNGGKYHLFIDYKPVGADSKPDKVELNVTGKDSENKETFSQNLAFELNGLKVAIENENNFISNQIQTFKIYIENNGSKITEDKLEKYLGTNAHIVMIGKTEKQFTHIHSIKNPQFPIYAETFIEIPDLYRIWV